MAECIPGGDEGSSPVRAGATASRINRTFVPLDSSYQAIISALDYVRIGIAIATDRGALLICNHEARRILDLDDGLRLGRTGRLECRSGAQSNALLAAIGEISTSSAREGRSAERLLFIERRSGARPFIIEVAPVRNAAGEVAIGFSGVVIFLVDPESTRSISTERLSRLYGLSQAEAAVAHAMVDGLSAVEIADLRGTTEATVRLQVKSVYAKTGVHRRADLVRLALSVNPPIERHSPNEESRIGQSDASRRRLSLSGDAKTFRLRRW